MARLHRPKAGFWIRAWVMILYPITSLLFRMRWLNLERMPAPEQGGALIAINHLSHADTIVMARLVWSSGRIPRFLIKGGVFEWPVIGRMMSVSAAINAALCDAAHKTGMDIDDHAPWDVVAVVQGPAPLPLRQFATRFSGNTLTITVA